MSTNTTPAPIFTARREVQGGPATGGNRTVIAWNRHQGPGWNREALVASGGYTLLDGLLVEIPRYSITPSAEEMATLPWVAGWTGNARACSRPLTEAERAEILASVT